MQKIEVEISGVVKGVQKDGVETKDAITEMILQAEMHGNNGPSRIYLEPVTEVKIVKLDQYQKGVLRTEGDPVAPMQRLYDVPNQERLLALIQLLEPIMKDADAFKKAIFYGKPASYALIASPVTTVEEFTCGRGMTRHLHSILGLLTEVGELLEHCKNAIYCGLPVSKEDWVKEYGDVGWYHALGADAAGATLSEVAQVNIDKLRRRYPEKFTEALAQEHDSH